MEPLGIDGAWVLTPRIHRDNRGDFHEWFRGAEFAADLGYEFTLSQANCSVSHRGVVRGIHFSDVPPGQAKYVICPAGEILDVVVDIRIGSPDYGRWEAVTLSAANCRAIFITEGLGHAFIALSPSATVMYLCSTPYAPAIERGITPFDPAIGISWPQDTEVTLSDKDATAPTLAEAAASGLLPTHAACQAHQSHLRTTTPTP
jgi:dTDP-4-dehydrorhamnose 3,5-epimerase